MYIQLNGQVLYYEKTGEGSPLILLHGNGESHEIFDALIPGLSRQYTVYAIDSRGQGGSATPKSYHYADMAQDVVNFITSLEIERPIICGYSDGGIVALMVAMERSELLSSIVVCGANLSPAGLTGKARREMKSLYKKTGSPLIAMMLEEPNIPAESLSKITIPAIICAGSKDIIKPKETQTIADHIPNSTLHIFEGETHSSYVVHSDKLHSVLSH